MSTWRDRLPAEAVERLLAAARRPKTPFLAIAAAAWVEPHRRAAFVECYRRMRQIDDLVDAAKPGAESMSTVKRERLTRAVHAGCKPKGLKSRFRPAAWIWQAWGRSMLHDTRHNGFRNVLELRRYSEGAAVAPGAIFLQLCGCPPAWTEREIRLKARPLALYCYLVHLARDLQEDALAGVCNIPSDLLHSVGLDRAKLLHTAGTAHPSEALRRLVGRLRAWALRYQRETRRGFATYLAELPPDGAFSLEAVFHLYTQVFKRLDPGGGALTGAMLTPTPAELEEGLKRLLDGEQQP